MNNISNNNKNEKRKDRGIGIAPYSDAVVKKGRKLKIEAEYASEMNLAGQNVVFLMNGWRV